MKYYFYSISILENGLHDGDVSGIHEAADGTTPTEAMTAITALVQADYPMTLPHFFNFYQVT